MRVRFSPDRVSFLKRDIFRANVDSPEFEEHFESREFLREE